jgi:hypothetical protein
MTIDRDEFNRSGDQLRLHALALVGRNNCTFPHGYDPEAEGATWCSVDYPLEEDAGGIDDVLGSSDALQEAPGLEGGEPRHRRFLSGRCNPLLIPRWP